MPFEFQPLKMLNHFAGLSMTESALSFLTGIADGDSRTALNSLQSAVDGFRKLDKYVITKDDIRDSLKKTHFLYDRKGTKRGHLSDRWLFRLKTVSDIGFSRSVVYAVILIQVISTMTRYRLSINPCDSVRTRLRSTISPECWLAERTRVSSLGDSL